MTDKTPRQRGATVRAAIDRLTSTQLLALAQDLSAALTGIDDARAAEMAQRLGTFHGVAVLALRVAFGVGGNGAGKPHTLEVRLPVGDGAIRQTVHGVTFSKGAETPPFLPA